MRSRKKGSSTAPTISSSPNRECRRSTPIQASITSGSPTGYGQQKRDEYTARDYHKVSDEVKPDWDLAGAVEDLQLLLRSGLSRGRGRRYPEWKPGTEFRAKREEMLKGFGPDR